MIDDPDTDDLIQSDLDGTSSAEARARVAERVAADPALKAEQQRLRGTIEALDRLKPEDPPAGFADTVLSEVRALHDAAGARGGVPFRPRGSFVRTILPYA